MAEKKNKMTNWRELGSITEDGFEEVWAYNLDVVFEKIRQIVQKYPYVAMDTEFPGVYYKVNAVFRYDTDYQYQMLKRNVNLLKLIQLGLTFYDEAGNKPPGVSTFQFNFNFNLSEDSFAPDSIGFLLRAGIQLQRHSDEGIDAFDFAELMMSSGLVLTEEVTWIAFSSSYDFGYLLRALTNQDLPEHKEDFFQLLSIFFVKPYDVKYLIKSCRNLRGGLQDVANQLNVQRVGTPHQAGSDSFVTGAVFFRIKKVFFDGHMDWKKHCGKLIGLGIRYATNANIIFPFAYWSRAHPRYFA